ncbi:MAG: hypothetical protein ACOZDY_10685 [Pseudomonadota bacterium]
MTIWNVARLAGILTFALIASACGTSSTADGRLKESTTDYWWREEVKFSTGEVIVVTRGESRVMRGEMGRGNGLMFYSAWLEADLPGVGKTRWEGTLTPLVLNVTPKGDWYLIGIVENTDARLDYKLRRGTRYTAFQLKGKDWQRLSFRELPEGLQPNLLAYRGALFFTGTAREGQLISLEAKQRLDTLDNVDRQYLYIDRSRGE